MKTRIARYFEQKATVKGTTPAGPAARPLPPSAPGHREVHFETISTLALAGVATQPLH